MTYEYLKIHNFIDNNFCICYNINKRWDQSQLWPVATAIF